MMENGVNVFKTVLMRPNKAADFTTRQNLVQHSKARFLLVIHKNQWVEAVDSVASLYCIVLHGP